MRFFTLNYGHKFGHNFALKIEVLLVLKKVLLTVEMPGFRTILWFLSIFIENYDDFLTFFIDVFFDKISINFQWFIKKHEILLKRQNLFFFRVFWPNFDQIHPESLDLEWKTRNQVFWKICSKFRHFREFYTSKKQVLWPPNFDKKSHKSVFFHSNFIEKAL